MSNLDDKKLTEIAAGGDAHTEPDAGTPPAPGDPGVKRPGEGGGDSGSGAGGGTPIEDDSPSTTPGQG